jgi:hypothetical protein
VAVSKTPGVGITNIQAMQASPGEPDPKRRPESLKTDHLQAKL